MAGAKFGGAETAFVDMCMAMAEAGHDVKAITRKNDIRVSRLRDAGIEVYTLPFGGVLDIYTPFMMSRIIKDFKPDIVQTWMSRASQKIPHYTEKKGKKPYLVVSRLGGYYKLKNYKNTDYFATITPDIKHYLEDQGVDPDKIKHINNFAETEDIEKPVNRADYDILEDAPLFLALGRLHTSKAFDTLIKAAKEVPESHIWIAGEGPDHQELQELINSLGVQDRVKLLGWRCDRAALFQAADFCIFPSRYEPFGTVFVQAWANKTPLITTDSDGPKQFVRHEEDGLITPIDDVSAMAASMTRMIENPDLAKKCVRNGYQRYLNEFTKDAIVSAYLDYFTTILKEYKAA